MRRLTRVAILDWLPLPAIFAAYHLAGWISRRLARPLCDAGLAAWDQRVFGTNPGVWLTGTLPGPALDLLEVFYWSYYVLVPLAPWLLYAREGRPALWRLWASAGASYLICDFLFPWFPSTPPRLLWSGFAAGGAGHSFNRWILDHFSIGGNVFPSSHVAAATTLAIAHLRFHRLRGGLFLAWAMGIALATVSGGYHYGIDALGGVAVGIAGEYAGAKLFVRLAAPAQSRRRSPAGPG